MRGPRAVDGLGVYDFLAPYFEWLQAFWEIAVGRQAVRHTRRLAGQQLSPGDRVLDAGTGTGRTMRRLLRESPPAEVLGIDVSSQMLTQARARLGRYRMPLAQADVQRLPIANEAGFDLVTAVWLLETLRQPKSALRELQRVLKQDGQLIWVSCTEPAHWLLKPVAWLMDFALRGLKLGRLLPRNSQPMPRGPRAFVRHFLGGFVTLVAMGKCCWVS